SLLEVVHDLFEEQTSLENVILKTLQRAQRLLKCERAAVMLLEDGTEECGVKGFLLWAGVVSKEVWSGEQRGSHVVSIAVAFPSVPQPDPSTDPSLVPKSVEEEEKKSEGEGAERKKEKEEEPEQKLEEEMDGRENSVDGQVVSVGKVDSRGEKRRDSVLGGYQRTTGCDDPERDGTAAVENQEPTTRNTDDENTVGGHSSREVNTPMKNGPVPNDSDTTDTPTRRKRSNWGSRRRIRRMRSTGETTDGEDEEERQQQQQQQQQHEHQMPLVSNNNKRAPEEDDPLHHQTKKHITSPSGERQGQQEEEEAMVVVAEGKMAGTGSGTETQKVEPTKKRAARAWGRKGSRPQLVSLEGSKVMTAALPPAAASSGGVSSEVV
ncbi:hypothetical protein Pcinc_027051, partial [Petrolisthes cinctipes]